jgi:UDP-N-acetyl-D-mannosaminuronic acid dehydrogenase
MGELDVVVVGGAGHVGLPLSVAFADRGLKVAIYDLSEAAVATISAGRLPFDEPGAHSVLAHVLQADSPIVAPADPAAQAAAGPRAKVIVVIP